ncbi:unnamed protein product, partial [Durusdinium trenchii]
RCLACGHLLAAAHATDTASSRSDQLLCRHRRLQQVPRMAGGFEFADGARHRRDARRPGAAQR